jgi:cytochrome c-type biogenesis protein CcmE
MVVAGSTRLSPPGRLMERVVAAPRLRYWDAMDPARKRRVRLVVALSAAVLLAGALVYTSFSASSEARSPSQLLAAASADRSYQLTGRVVQGSIRREGTTWSFRVRDRDGSAAVPVRYTGAVSDTFKAGREVIVTVHRKGEVFVGDKDSLVTKCPSKFTTKTTPT